MIYYMSAYHSCKHVICCMSLARVSCVLDRPLGGLFQCRVERLQQETQTRKFMMQSNAARRRAFIAFLTC